LIAPGDIESIERATLAGLGCDSVQVLDGWLLPRVKAPMGRAKSAVPIRHDLLLDPAGLETITSAYAVDGLKVMFRVPDAAGMMSVRHLLAGMGFGPVLRPTHVMIADLTDVAQISDSTAIFTSEPDPDWSAVFTSPGFDPDDGAARVQALARARNTCFGRVNIDGMAVAVGVGNYNWGWVSLHGMRTALAFRGQGHAATLLAGLARIGLEQGLSRAVLQVEEGNWSAFNLYRRAGFRTAWRYDYWMA